MRFKAVVFDWAGTVVDFGSLAPAAAFIDAFAQFGVQTDLAAARAPMGAPKRDHIAQMLQEPGLAERWRAARNTEPDDQAIDALYEAYAPLAARSAAKRTDLIPGAAEAVAELREAGLKIGATTGYPRGVMAHVAPAAAAQGFRPDALVCADDLPETRPGPLAMYKVFAELGVHPPEAVIKVDDTGPGLAEGRAAGCLCVGVALSGDAAGLSREAFEGLNDIERAALRASATQKLTAAGADHVIDSVADLPALLKSL